MNKQEQMNQVYLESYQSAVGLLTSLRNGLRKKVTIKIDSQRMADMKTNNYRLCFAKKVGDAAYNVVWQSFDKQQYYANNEFSWEPMYEIFCTKTYEESVTVKVTTNTVAIGLGEICTLDEAGNISDAQTGGSKLSLNLINNNSDFHVGVNQLATDLLGKRVSSPIYLSKDFAVKGEVNLVPKEKVLVWFQQNIETSTIFGKVTSVTQEIDLTSQNEATYFYNADGNWEKK